MALPNKTRQDEVFEALRSPAALVLQRYGIEVKLNEGTGWLNLSRCPWCGHDKNNQCGVKEARDDRGFIHAVKCQHPHHSPTGEPSPHYADFLAALGEISQDEAEWVKGLKNRIAARPPASAGSPLSRKPSPTVPATAEKPAARAAEVVEEPRLMNSENNTKARRRLFANPKALQYLTEKRGYTEQTIARFKLGLSEPYEKDGATVHADALAAPLVGIDGRFYKKYVNYAIPGVTEDHREKPQKAWSPGPARAYYSGDAKGKRWLFVCDGLKDVWALAQLLEGSELDQDVVLVSSTNGGGGLPAEWRTDTYWDRWEKVFAGHDNDKPDPLTGRRAGDQHAKALAMAAQRDVSRVTPPGVKDWNDWVLAGHDVAAFRKLLEDAETIPLVDPIKEADDGISYGRFSATAVSIVGAYHNGHLYEPVRTLVRDIDTSTGESVEYYDTIVIRSDRTQHRVKRMPTPKGVSDHNAVYRLFPDGTMLSRLPAPNPALTWSWPSIKAWLDRKDRTPPLATLLEKITGHLKGSMWLPHDDNYTLLACTVVASYVQQIFDAVPLILVTGAAGTGKSELGNALRAVGANCGAVLGVVSAATMARHIDNTRGLVIIDDLEDIASVRDAMFTDLVQTLKLSYKKSTAMKMVTEMRSNGQAVQKEFNFFGIKVIGNTRGTDAILGTRMLTIETRKMPEGLSLNSSLVLVGEASTELRNHLHTWAFNNVKAVAEAYLTIFPHKSSRSEEIAAPLRVVATLSGNGQVLASLEKALERQSRVRVSPDAPEEVMREALEAIIRRSAEVDGVLPTWVTVTQVMMEMSLMVDENYGKSFTTSLADIAKPEWIGRTLRQHYADPDAEQKRTNMYGRGMRAYKLADDFLAKVKLNIAADNEGLANRPLKSITDFKAFCAGCPTCPYRNRCEMQQEREAREKQRPLAIVGGQEMGGSK